MLKSAAADYPNGEDLLIAVSAAHTEPFTRVVGHVLFTEGKSRCYS